MPSVTDQFHAFVLQDAVAIIESHGGQVASNEYHEQPALKAMLQDVETLAAHNLRTRADRIARIGKHIFRFDAKTCRWARGCDFAIEWTPFWMAVLEYNNADLPHLFLCERTDGSESFGLWADLSALSRIQRVIVPRWRRGDEWERIIEQKMRLLNLTAEGQQWPPVVLASGNVQGGSGDPFVALDLSGVPPWREELDAFCSACKETQ